MRVSRSRQWCGTLLTGTFAVLACSATAYANAAQSHFSGDQAAEPNGLRDVAIEHEALSFDLRSLEHGNWGPHAIPVSATYRIVNHGDAVIVPIVFASGTVVPDAFHVTFDRMAIPATHLTAEQAATIPPAWSPPANDGRRQEIMEGGSAAFTLTIPPGPHELAVSYAAQVDWGYNGGTGTIVYRVGYILAPAREWKSFGTLDATVDVPAGWRATASISLVRTNDTLRGHFDKLPADTIEISTQAPVPRLWGVLQIALPVLGLLVLFGGGFGLYQVGRWRGKKLVVSDAYGVLTLVWAASIAAIGSAVAFRATFLLPHEQTAEHGYGVGFGVLGSIVLALIAIPVGWFTVRSGRHSMLPKPPPDDVRWR
ncbi:hypothetical protein BH11MYX2_BH11MYX2_17420 [soil metagenome]